MRKVMISYILAKNHMVTKLQEINQKSRECYILAKNHMVTKLISMIVTRTTRYILAKNLVLCQEKVQIKYALLMLSYPAKASALSSNAA